MAHTSFIVTAIRQETPDTKSFELKATAPLSYRPGQFLTLLHTTRTEEIRRQYSLSSHPTLDQHPVITVKRIANGEFSRLLIDNIRVGDQLRSTGASGQFTLPDEVAGISTIVLLAAGSGITPVYSLLREILHFHPAIHVVLVYSSHDTSSCIFYQELLELQQAFAARLTIEFLFSVNKNLMRARLGKTVLEEILRQHVPSPESTLAFVCGPLDYRQMAIVTLVAYGVAAERVRKEVFHTPPSRQQPMPPDTNKHRVTVKYAEQSFELNVQYPVSILAAAKSKKIELPYSCEAGRCGTCSATCTSGVVWMSRNEVLTDRELAAGRVLTCTGYPVSGDVVLEIP